MADDKFSEIVQKQLDAVEPNTFIRGELVYPCWARLKDQTIYEAVLVMDQPTFEFSTGFRDPMMREEKIHGGDCWIAPADIEEIRESPKRLPARFANQIASGGESGMGMFVFTVVFTWFRRRTYVTTTINLLEYPPFTGPGSIKAVIPHKGKRSVKSISEVKAPVCMFIR